jgi:hypothetical protein
MVSLPNHERAIINFAPELDEGAHLHFVRLSANLFSAFVVVRSERLPKNHHDLVLLKKIGGFGEAVILSQTFL